MYKYIERIFNDHRAGWKDGSLTWYPTRLVEINTMIVPDGMFLVFLL
jgi:hypothetical protein